MMGMRIEYSRAAQVTGLKGILRECHVPVSAISEASDRYAGQEGRSADELSLIVCCLEDMISVAACKDGKIVDGTDCLRGEGPLSPAGCGTMTVSDVIDLCYSGVSEEEALRLCSEGGGLVSLCGTKDVHLVRCMAEDGDLDAELALEGMIYQTCKVIGEMAAALKGRVDGILLTGRLSGDPLLTGEIRRRIGFAGKVAVC